ncbi:RelA/SpoT family protein [Noviluteimonas gilva]|uniref:GTP pyrophosphokinase n=1 Tax=Noviluteimonas gilva TaxID=2682097 RepID=A0A7C9LNB8_9GAMM|nr:bifunctional (p)ppGpp synthetase/guanosine-3',5'-bis(diphosphate) 3'-pyrophosphohydrolase [Lysobacter gilvus]MUV15704.1 RelA/SpoT family protein [Lysobacter gilvus]
MSKLTPLTLPALLALPPADAIPQPLRDAMLQVDGDPFADAPDPPAVLVDTLGSLARLGADPDVTTAAILRALPSVEVKLRPRIAKDYPQIAALLEGQRAAVQVWSLHAEQHGHGNSEGLRRLLLAIVRDLRVVLVLLSRHLARLRLAATAPPDQQRALAQLTRDIHAPLANRLGIWQLKWELEDLAFRYLEPETYQQIARLLDDKRSGRERYIETVKATLRDALAASGIRGEVAGRPKHIYSIWRKMQKKNAPIGELYDLRALRVLVDDVPACYAVLGVVHALWLPVPDEFDDYIARPKRNDYRSLHTAVIGPEGKTLEVQIRTHEMHAQAELGVAAHWKYKEGRAASKSQDAAMEKRIAWMRQLLDSTGEEASLLRELDTELAEDRIYVLTPRGEVIDLPQGATPIDFAYRLHTDVGHRTRGAKVDGRIVPLDHVLRSGDRVEILTGKVAEPRRDWLVQSNGFLASARSREKVRSWFHKLDRARNLQAGRELLDRELKRLGLAKADLAPVLSRFNVSSDDELVVLVALGDVGPHQVGRALLEHERALAEPEPVHSPVVSRAPAKKGRSDFTIAGMGNLLAQPARCCQPLPGEPIVGYLTRGKGISVHRAGCATYLRLAAAQPQRAIPVEWGGVGGGHDVDVVLLGLDRKWLLKDLTNLIAQENAHVAAISTDPERGTGRVRLNLRLRVSDYGQLSALLGKLAAVPGVEDARRAT